MRIIFIDADGCLHPSPPHSGLLRLCWLPLLADIVAPYADIRVVMHSSWRHDMPSKHLADLLAPLGDRYLGVTSGDSRYPSILSWVGQRGVTDYRIIDDMPGEFPSPAPGELIVCNGRLGLTDPVAREALGRWLQGEKVTTPHG